MIDDPAGAIESMGRARRRTLVLGALAVVVVVIAVAGAATVFRDRTVYVVGGDRAVSGRIEGHPGFRAQWPFTAIYMLGPGVHPISGGRGPVRSAIHVPFAPWTTQIVAPAEEGQC